MPASLPPPQHHWVLPFAACASDDWLPAVQAMPPAGWRHLGKLLQGMKLVHTDSGDVRSLSPPHERVLARALGLSAPDGLIPWAAWQHLQGGGVSAARAWAFITPCHWAMGREHATMTDPAALDLTEAESRTLLAAMQPYFETYGITLHHAAPTRWLAEGELFRDLPSAALDRVLGRNVDTWLPGAESVEARFGAGPPQGKLAPEGLELAAPNLLEQVWTGDRGEASREPRPARPRAAHAVASVGAKAMRLLQNEMQMLLYTHAVNDARAAKRQLAVNSFWISGSGALPDTFHAKAQPDTTVSRSLAHAAFSDDWAAYTQAWTALNASEGARLLALQQGGATIRLSLCGERNALTFETTSTGIFSRMKSLFGQQPLPVLLEQL
ncbi:MAG: hypothetical protein Q7U63_05380 [Polaromonas sp.]|uniref:hypothetical protein n=1 Tax=Polaromonas sp. TaxID=1869339 RepID=UPI002724BF99|nr:hypothetical protein [Polaromonas sp.]MDO9113211.1 hypothetical protein [Polaromonas sp.]MDP1888086.1 hypothetical protein [Polaromonas sp.]